MRCKTNIHIFIVYINTTLSASVQDDLILSQTSGNMNKKLNEIKKDNIVYACFSVRVRCRWYWTLGGNLIDLKNIKIHFEEYSFGQGVHYDKCRKRHEWKWITTQRQRCIWTISIRFPSGMHWFPIKIYEGEWMTSKLITHSYYFFYKLTRLKKNRLWLLYWHSFILTAIFVHPISWE